MMGRSKIFYRSRVYTTRKGSLEVTYFPSVRMSVCPSSNFAKFNFYVKLNYGTPHMTMYGTGSGPEVECEASTSKGLLCPAIFEIITILLQANFKKTQKKSFYRKIEGIHFILKSYLII